VDSAGGQNRQNAQKKKKFEKRSGPGHGPHFILFLMKDRIHKIQAASFLLFLLFPKVYWYL
jgi:hypothetical protein